jgi:hypothetical protein
MRTQNESGLAQLGCCLGIVIINLTIGSWSVNYLLNFFLEKTIPWIGAALIGLVAGEITVPVALVVWILNIFGIL